MKRLFSCFLLLTIILLTACEGASYENTNPDAWVQNGSEDSDAAIRIKVNADNAESILRGGILYSNFVVEATLQTVEKDMYTFGDIQVITGVYEEETLPITMFQAHNAFNQADNYQVGERYILLVQTPDSVNYSGELRYTDIYILCKLNHSDPEKIDKLLVEGFSMESMLGTRQELIDMVEEEVGLQNAYYNPCDQYVHSDVIADIVQGADVVAKVRFDVVDIGGDYLPVDTCVCTLQKLYKGKISPLKENRFSILPRKNNAKVGEEYLVLLKRYFDTDYGQAAKENAIIPMTDTERVNEVYAALGIEPEE